MEESQREQILEFLQFRLKSDDFYRTQSDECPTKAEKRQNHFRKNGGHVIPEHLTKSHAPTKRHLFFGILSSLPKRQQQTVQ